MITVKGALALLIAAFVPFIAIVLVAGGNAREPAAAYAAPRAPAVPMKEPQNASSGTTPSAAEFAAKFVGVTNRAAEEHGDSSKVTRPRCVQAAPGHYMCAYTVIRNGMSSCHLMQARWTPELASTITVTLAGRTGRCRTLREAIRTLG